jgi:hypothetical protein
VPYGEGLGWPKSLHYKCIIHNLPCDCFLQQIYIVDVLNVFTYFATITMVTKRAQREAHLNMVAKRLVSLRRAAAGTGIQVLPLVLGRRTTLGFASAWSSSSSKDLRVQEGAAFGTCYTSGNLRGLIQWRRPLGSSTNVVERPSGSTGQATFGT